MITEVIWAVSFVTLFVGVFWLHVIFLKEEKKNALQYKPKVSFLVPAKNEEKGLWKTVHSIVTLNYPKDKIEIFVINHGSTDKTRSIAENLIKSFSDHKITLINKEWKPGHIKAHALNEALPLTTGEIVACVDADSMVLEDSLQELLPYFTEEHVGAVISAIKVDKPRNIYEKVQHLEYVFATFTRTLMSKIDTLYISQGALSAYRRKLLVQFGGFDEKNMTEDLEIAMRLRKEGYTVKIAKKSVSYTCVPANFNTLWSQRVRWFRGFLYNTNKYRGMVFKKKYGMLGRFQYPLNILSVCIILMMFALLVVSFFDKALGFIPKLKAFGHDIWLVEIPTLKEILLNVNITVFFPLAISFLIALLIYHLAHKNLKEKWQYPGALLAYLTVYPLLRSLHWVTAFYKEVIQAKKKW